MRHQRPAAADIARDVPIPAAWPNPVAEAATAPTAANDAAPEPFRPTPAMADVPAGVARLVAGGYGVLILVFFALFAGSPLAFFSISICAFFVAMFFGVAKLFLAVEAAPGRRPSFERFLHVGLDTLTGRSRGGEALVQMLIVPVLVTAGLAAMGIIGKIYIG
jgi:hypothetical protein